MVALYVLKGSILVEHDRLAEAEQPWTEGLDLIRWTDLEPEATVEDQVVDAEAVTDDDVEAEPEPSQTQA